MMQPIKRDAVLESLKKLPENARLDDIIKRLVFMAKLEEALNQSEARELVTHQEVLARISA